MPLLFVRRDITSMRVDAVVNAANESLLGGSGVDGAIHQAAGPELLAECRTLGGCKTGEAKITGGYRMPCKYIIHTVGPIYRGGMYGEAEQLRDCYRNSLKLAEERGCESVAFPAISTGVYGYPFGEATAIAVQTVKEYLTEHDMTVYLVFFGRAGLHRERDGLEDYINKNREQTTLYSVSMNSSAMTSGASAKGKSLFGRRQSSVRKESSFREEISDSASGAMSCAMADAEASETPDFRSMLDESFSEMLLRKIDESGMTDAECYKRANIDRKLFSKIRSDRAYRPSKPTVIAFAVALKLGADETEEMLKKAGYALSESALFDVIIRYFIERGEYDVLKINEALFDYDQTLLGA